MHSKLFFLLSLFIGTAFIVNAQNNYSEISLPELMKKKQSGGKEMVILDVRTNGEYFDSASMGKHSNIGWIKGTIHIELQTLLQDSNALKQLAAYKDKDIYLICSHSYRSRSASNMLLKNGFSHVNNVRGGMTEWFRRYDELAPYRQEFYETKNLYTNISAAQLNQYLESGKEPVLIGIRSTPRFFYDSATVKFYDYFPSLKNTVYFNSSDSAQVLELAQKKSGHPIVLFNMVNNGAAELADWLSRNGIPQVSYLVGGNYYFYEYIRNQQLTAKTAKYLVQKSNIEFITAPNYCDISGKENTQLVDLRADTIFNKIVKGIKYDYKHARNAINFPAENGADQFEKKFPDKNKVYVLLSQNGINGLELADVLAKKDYKVAWIMGGLQRLEWYTINMEDFKCANLLRE